MWVTIEMKTLSGGESDITFINGDGGDRIGQKQHYVVYIYKSIALVMRRYQYHRP